VGVATADLYPQFTLSGSLGRQGDTLGALGHSGNEFWSFGPSGSLPIFDARKRRFNIEIRNALQEQSLWTYELSVLTALSEVEDALVAWQGEKDRQKDLNDAVTANRHAVELANQLFTFGRTDFLSVLDAQRSLFAAEDIAAQSRRNLAANLITLYKALGGGWQLNDPNNVSP
jgi:outer membrane protein TolC